ncbi:MAG: hypothetical protein ABW079_06630 [Sedimenticola sp.]
MSAFGPGRVAGFEYDKLFTSTVLACAMFYQQNNDRNKDEITKGEMYSSLKDKLSRMYGAISELEGQALGAWDSDKNNPGWLIRIDSPMCIRVPAHLASLFPDSNELKRLATFGQEIKTTKNSLLYLSGSNATKKLFDIVDDVDFCEYVPNKGDNIELSILGKISTENKIVCVALNCPKSHGKYEKPFTQLDKISECLRKLDPNNEEHSTFMAHFLARQPNARVFEVSNAIIFCNEEYTSKGFKRTFAHQEVQITPSDIVPNPLDDVMELGRYVVWLIEQVKKYRDEGNISKMLKRTLALTRVSWMKDYTLDIGYFFENFSGLYENELKTIDRLKDKISSFGVDDNWNESLVDLEYYQKLARLDLEKAKLKEGRIYPKGAEASSMDIVSRLSDEIHHRSNGALAI